VFCVSLAILPVSTWAICEQFDLQGTWTAQVWGEVYSDAQCWDQCTLTIGPDGIIEAQGAYDTCLGESSEIYGGELTISSGCVIGGYIETSNGTIYVDNGAILENGLVLGAAEE
jgi:hypothetical protein